MSVEERITDLEMIVASQEKTIDELSEEVFRLSKLVDSLMVQVKTLVQAYQDSLVKPQSEETPPPHY